MGEEGLLGVHGEEGVLGLDGVEGLLGELGEDGEVGDVGLVGEVGEEGLLGELGVDGLDGVVTPVSVQPAGSIVHSQLSIGNVAPQVPPLLIQRVISVTNVCGTQQLLVHSTASE